VLFRSQIEHTQLNNGDDAEEAVVDAIQKTGTALLQDWAEKKNCKAEEELKKNPAYRTHKKKESNGKLQ